ncbi:MAG TPA: hypothetical protein DIU00_19925 [Phycisphaerales bacterium]|nr:hypothetical protein [Phycisphaerales bacterium]
MSEIDEKEIRRRFEAISEFEAASEITARDLDRARERLTEQTSGQPTKQQRIWRTILKSRITKLAAAAVMIAGTMIGLHWLGDGSPAYGITEALELWKNAEIVHIKGWDFLHTGDDTQLQKFPFAIWYEKKSGRFKYWLPDSQGWPPVYTTETPRYRLHVSDGQYIMETGYRHSDSNSATPLVMFIKLSAFEQRLRIRTMKPFPAYMANLDQVKGFTKVGREQIKNKTVDIWEGVITSAGPFPIKKRIWLSPKTGEIVRIFTWIDAGENSIRWVALSDADTIEYNVVPPANCFNTDPPAGHKQMNTKETVVERELSDGGPAKFHSCIGFTLKDGSVIYGWHANNKPEESQAHLFTDLEPGGPLPNLPAKVVGLRPWPAAKGIILAGRHLTFTRKKGKFYEWGIYVSDENTPERNTFAGYEVISKYNFGPRPFFDGRPHSLGQDHELTINSEQEFDIWVRGAMAELSDDGKAPESIIYKNVLQLAEKIRNTFNK